MQRKQGVLPQDHKMAVQYRARMNESAKVFDSNAQRAIIDVLLDSEAKQEFECYYVATEPSHVHVLLGWRDERGWMRLRSTIKGSISRGLNNRIFEQKWLSEGGSRKHVQEQEHFDHLVSTYLPRHRGWKWSRDHGYFQ